MDLSNPTLIEVVDRISSSPSVELLDKMGALLRAERAAPSGDAAGIFSAAYEALLRVPAELACTGRVVSLLCIATHHYAAAAKPERGLAPAADAVTAARRLGDAEWLSKALKIHGVLLADTGNIPDAIAAYAEALDLARQAKSRQQECDLWVNIGIAYQYSAHFADAVVCYERAVELAGDSPSLRAPRKLALSNLANAALESGDAGKGLASIERAIELDPEPTSAPEQLSRVHSEYYYVRLLLQAGLPEQAKQRVRLARRFADQSRSERAQVLASIAEGLTNIYCGQVDTGLTRLKRALEFSRGGMRATLHDALAALIKGYDLAGQPDAALVYLREIQRLHHDGLQAQVLMHHAHHLQRIDRRLDENASAVLEQTQSALRVQLGERDLVRSRVAMLEQQSVAAELHDDATGEHCYRVGRLSSQLAAEYGVDARTCFLIDLAARLHDIGKLAVPDGILLKPGRLTPEERAIMEAHATAGAELLAESRIPQMYVAEEIARHHHERFDGTGYPARLKGTMIPLAARITSLADVFDALTHVRPYKHAWTVDDSLAEIIRLRGRHFDPELTDLFLTLVARLRREHVDLDAFLGEEAKHSPFIRARRELAAALKGSADAMLKVAH
jgi:putative two-component system response regulator